MKLSHSHKIRTMTLTTTKLTEFQLRNSLPLTSHSLFSNSCAPKASSHPLRLHFSCSASLRTNKHSKPRSPNTSPNAPWHSRWPSRKPPLEDPPRKIAQPYAKEEKTRFFTKNKGQNAIERIVLRLRNLGLGVDEGEGVEEGDDGIAAGDFAPVMGEERLADLLKREWIRPDTFFSMKDKENENDDEVVLPWERDEGVDGEGEIGKERKRRVKAPTLAELTLEDEELRRLRRNGMFLRERISIPKAGLTKEVMQKIHDKWRKEELVRLKFHEVLAHDMRTAHELVERRTGGLVIWRAGSVMVVFRGINYQGPPSKSQLADREGNALFVPNVSSADVATVPSQELATSIPGKSKPAALRADCTENMTEEEAEYNQLLDGLGPRFEEWWGTGVLPVDADMLPGKVPGYKTPFRLLPTGMRSRLTNGEMTNLRKLAKSLPCHFALGRNRNHQGLAAAILRLWEKSLVAKIAVKRGIQNTNNKLMADELKNLTGGVLLLRNKYFIVIYRGKDFLPTSVAAALAERQELTKQIQDVEENVRSKEVEAVPSGEDEGMALAGTLAEFYEAQARWGRNVTPEEHEKMIEDASRAKTSRLMKRVEHKLAIAQAKKLRAERLLSKIEVSMVPSGPDYDQETITDEERAMFRRVGLRMKAYLPLGIRGVFDGVIENMHLHWKYRELVKLISKQKTLAFVEDTARLLEYESGGILVAIERVPKGFALIFYRGKNYRRPIKLRPRNLLTKAKALKRSVAMQRHEALSQHISDLEKTIEQMKKEIHFAQEDNADNVWSLEEHGQLNPTSEILRSEAEAAYVESEEEEEEEDEEDGDDDDYEDDDDHEDDDHKNEYFTDGEANEDSEFSSFVDRDHFMTNDS